MKVLRLCLFFFSLLCNFFSLVCDFFHQFVTFCDPSFHTFVTSFHQFVTCCDNFFQQFMTFYHFSSLVCNFLSLFFHQFVTICNIFSLFSLSFFSLVCDIFSLICGYLPPKATALCLQGNYKYGIKYLGRLFQEGMFQRHHRGYLYK